LVQVVLAVLTQKELAEVTQCLALSLLLAVVLVVHKPLLRLLVVQVAVEVLQQDLELALLALQTKVLLVVMVLIQIQEIAEAQVAVVLEQ
jgi:hypothetical protein